MKNQKNSSVEELIRHAQGTGDNSIEKNISADDLDYLAARGFEKAGITADDVDEVIKKVESKSFSFANLNAILTGGMITLAISSIIIALIANDKKPNLEQNSKISVISILKDPVTLSEITINSPEQKKEIENVKGTQWRKEHFAKQNPEALQQQEPEVQPEDMSMIKVATVTQPSNSEVRFEQLPNAPVIYVEGLKVTNYHLFYYKNDKKFELINGGFDAEYGDKQDYLSKRNEIRNNTPKIIAVDVLQSALANFNNENYSGCITEMDVLLKINNSDVNALFYSAMSFHSMGKDAKAIAYFDRVLAGKNNIFHQEAEFYKAMALLQGGKKQEAREALKVIVDKGGFYSTRANELLQGR